MFFYVCMQGFCCSEFMLVISFSISAAFLFLTSAVCCHLLLCLCLVPMGTIFLISLAFSFFFIPNTWTWSSKQTVGEMTSLGHSHLLPIFGVLKVYFCLKKQKLNRKLDYSEA